MRWPAYLGRLAAGHCLDAGGPVVLLGDSGTGGSHLLITAQRLGADPHHGVGAPSEPPGWPVRNGVTR